MDHKYILLPYLFFHLQVILSLAQNSQIAVVSHPTKEKTP